MITINDVAKLAGVSIATVSNVVNKNGKATPQTVEKVQAAIEQLGYIPNSIAKGLKTSTTRNIGVLVEDISSFFSAAIIDGICEYCEQNDYTIMVSNLTVNHKIDSDEPFDYDKMTGSDAFQHSLNTNLNLLLTARICGLIYIGVYPRDVSGLLPKLDLPTVYTYAYATGEYCSINYDDYQGAKAAVDYLISRQHTRIALISGTINSIPGHKRMLGYQTALMENSIPFIPEYIKIGSWRYQDGYQLCNELLNLPNPPTAIFAMSDLMAYGCMNAAKDRGLSIPEDLSVHGFDNQEMSAYTYPALTTIGLPLRAMGIESAKAISLSKTADMPTGKQLLLACTHIPRGSV